VIFYALEYANKFRWYGNAVIALLFSNILFLVFLKLFIEKEGDDEE